MFQNIKFNKRYLMALGLSLVLLFVNTLGLLLNTMVGPITPSNNDVWTNYVSRPVGTGRTESDPYRISTPSELAYLIENLGAGSWYIELISDINLSGHEWIPIKTTAENSVRFKGNGHTISNMKIKQPKKDGVGLFEGNF